MNLIRESETEFWVGPNKTALIEGNIIYVIADGEQSPELARLQEKANSELATIAGGK